MKLQWCERMVSDRKPASRLRPVFKLKETITNKLKTTKGCFFLISPDDYILEYRRKKSLIFK